MAFKVVWVISLFILTFILPRSSKVKEGLALAP